MRERWRRQIRCWRKKEPEEGDLENKKEEMRNEEVGEVEQE